jgi:hypothetical protein
MRKVQIQLPVSAFLVHFALSRCSAKSDLGLFNLTALETLNTLLQRLLTTVQSSPVGGFPIPTPTSTNLTLQQRIEVAQPVPSRLHQDRMRIKEGVEIAGGVLGSA